MKIKRLAAIAMSLTTALGLGIAVSASPASASGSNINFGACIESLATSDQKELIPFQAPGKSHNGPGNDAPPGSGLHIPSGFEGSVGCVR